MSAEEEENSILDGVDLERQKLADFQRRCAEAQKRHLDAGDNAAARSSDP